MSTSSRGTASDSPAQAVTRKVCQSEDAQLAETLREEQAVVNQDVANRLDLVEKDTRRESDLDEAVEALGLRVSALEDLGPRLDASSKTIEDQARRLTSVEHAVEANQEALTRIEEKLDKVFVAPATAAPPATATVDTEVPVPDQGPTAVGDPILDHTVRELRAQVNGLLERESEERRQSGDGHPSHVHFAPSVKEESRKAVESPATSSNRTRNVRIKEEPYTSDEEELFADGPDGFESDQEEIPRGKVLSFWERGIGPKFGDLRSIKPADPRFDRLLSYRFYRLTDRTLTRDYKKTQQLRGFIKQLNTTLGDEKFSGADAILVFDFLIRLFEEAENLGMSKAQAFAVLPYYLSGDARKLFNTARRGKTGNGVSNWCEAVQWLLRTYADSATIRTAVQEFRAITQHQEEKEVPYGNRIRVAAYRCGNVFTDAELMNVFTDGLNPATRTLVARYRETAGRSLSLQQLVMFARDEGEAYRARQPGRNRPKGIIGVNTLAEERATADHDEGDPEMFGLLPDWSASADTADVPSTVADANDAILYGERPVRPPRIPYGSAMTNRARPGWQNQSRGPFNRELLARLICYICYGVGHLASQCTCPVRDVGRVKRNFDALTREEKERVPKKAIERALAFLGHPLANAVTGPPAQDTQQIPAEEGPEQRASVHFQEASAGQDESKN